MVSPGCAFEFAASIPADLGFYTIEVGSRGDLSFTRADLEATDWTVTFTSG